VLGARPLALTGAPLVLVAVPVALGARTLVLGATAKALGAKTLVLGVRLVAMPTAAGDVTRIAPIEPIVAPPTAAPPGATTWTA